MVENTRASTVPKKLRILCFHGYNNSAAILEWHMKNFISTTGHLCEFIFLDGFLEAREEPVGALVKRGFKPPFRSWFRAKF